MKDARTEGKRPIGLLVEKATDLGLVLLDQAQLRIAEERQRWSDAFENASFGIAVADPRTNRIRFANPAFAAMHAMTVAEIQSMDLLEMHPEEERTRVAALLAAGDRNGRTSYEATQVRGHGTPFPVHMDITSVRDNAGIVLYRIVSALDISEHRQTEAALRQAQKMEAIGNLTGGIAHDFNNLLGVIIGNLDLIQSQVASTVDPEELLTEALHAALKGAELTRRLLAFARRQSLQPTRVIINDLIGGTAKMLQRILGEDISISLDLAPDLAPVTIDAVQLEASLLNLATNARDAMPAGGQLTISTGSRYLDEDYSLCHPEVVAGEYIALEISDTGTGIPAEIIGRIFEPFFTTKEHGKGTGLGLSMVFGFMKQSGGHVAVYSQPGVGTTFRLYLPRAEASAPLATRSPNQVRRTGGGEVVLAVEDNDALRRIVVRQLRSLGYRPLEANQPSAALKILESQPVDVLFTDLVMSGDFDGIELARRSLKRWPQLKVLLTSGFPEARLRGNIGPLGASIRLLNKPYRAVDLGTALREALDTLDGLAQCNSELVPAPPSTG